MIEVQGLTKIYGNRAAIDNISFTVQKGEILGLLGQNGAGKTTTMKIITGFMAPTSGTAKVAGFDVFEDPIEVKKRVGYLPELPPLYEELLVMEYLNFIADLRGVPKSEKKKKIEKAIEQCQLQAVANRLIRNLSKGYRQRVGIAQAIIHDPQVVVLDEPTIGLDPKQVSEARGLIRGMKSERTLIYSSHILSEIAATCDRIIVIDQGKIVAQETIRDLNVKTVRFEIVVNKLDEELMKTIQAIPNISKVTRSEKEKNRILVEGTGDETLYMEVAKKVVQREAGLVRMAPVKMDLEEHYLQLIGARSISL